MIKWVNNKIIDIENINEKINICLKNSCFTNNGKNVLELQKKIHNIFKIDVSKSILMVCNGSMGINALVGGLNIFYNNIFTNTIYCPSIDNTRSTI